MATIKSDPFLLDKKSFVTETDGNTATIKRISKGKELTQEEKEIAGDYYNSALDEIDYGEIYNLKFGKNWITKHGASDEWMAKALTDKTYKEVFKKATGKNSPNISFASIKDSNLNWASIANNKDANNKSTSSGSDVLRYPLNKDKREFDYLKVCAYKYEPRGFGTLKDGAYTGEREGGGNVLTGDYRISEGNKTRKKPGPHTVFLPMEPSGLTEQNTTAWGDENINAIEAGFANIAGAGIQGATKGVTESAAGMGDATKDAAKTLTDALTPEKVSAFFAGKAVSNPSLFKRATGQVMNNNLELMFSGPSLRSFNYNFKFTPRDQAEANEIRRIIKFFKKSMAPIVNDQKMFLESPHVFKLEYIFKNGGQHPFLNKMKTCACTSFNAIYAPDGSYMTYDDGSMTSYNLSMSFGELNPIYNHDILEDSNDMGY